MPVTNNNLPARIDDERTNSGLSQLWSVSDHSGYGVTGSGATKLVDSGVAPLVAAARGYETIDDSAALKTKRTAYGWPTGNSKQARRLASQVGDGRDILVMPCHSPFDVSMADRTGGVASVGVRQWRPSNPDVNPDTGRPLKYEIPGGSNLNMGMHPSIPSAWLDDEGTRVIIAEGLLKGDSALTALLVESGVSAKKLKVKAGETPDQCRDRLRRMLKKMKPEQRALVLTVFSVTAWRKNQDWRHMNARGRTVFIGVDGDSATNRQVHKQVREMRDFLRDSHKVETCNVIIPVDPTGVNDKMGIDDFLAEHGTLAELLDSATNRLPDAPLADATEGRPVGSTWIMPVKGGMVRNTVMGEYDASGTLLNAYVKHEPVVAAGIEIIGSEEIEEGHADARGRSRISLVRDLRVTTPDGYTGIVRGYPDSKLSDIEEILRQARGPAQGVRWVEKYSPRLCDEIATAIRAYPADDHVKALAVRRTGLVPVSSDYIPAAVDEKAPPLERAWVLVTQSGSVGPRHYDDTKVFPEVSDAHTQVATPALPTDEEVRDDIKRVVRDLTEAFNRTPSMYAGLGKVYKAMVGGKPRGGLYVGSPHGSGKSIWAEFLNACAFGGQPNSMENATKTFASSITEGRADIATINDDLKRSVGDEQEWPHKMQGAKAFMRIGYDGPQAARGRMYADAITGRYVPGARDRSWPTCILFSELRADFDDSTMEKMLAIYEEPDFIKPGQAKAVIERLKDDGVPARISRAFMADYLLQLSVDAHNGEAYAQTHESLTAFRDRKFNEGAVALDVPEPWNTRHPECATGPILGLAMLTAWMKQTVDGDTTPGVVTVEEVEQWYQRGKAEIIAAQDAHVGSIVSEIGASAEAKLLDKFRRMVAMGRVYLLNDYAFGGDGLPVEHSYRDHPVGISLMHDGERCAGILAEDLAAAMEVSVRDVEAMLRYAGAIKAGNRWRHRKSHEGKQLNVMVVPYQALLSDHGKITAAVAIDDHVDDGDLVDFDDEF